MNFSDLFFLYIYRIGNFFINILNWFSNFFCLGFCHSYPKLVFWFLLHLLHWASLKHVLLILYLAFENFFLVSIYCWRRITVFLWGCHNTLLFSPCFLYLCIDFCTSRAAVASYFWIHFYWEEHFFSLRYGYDDWVRSFGLLLGTCSGKDCMISLAINSLSVVASLNVAVVVVHWVDKQAHDLLGS